MGDRSVDLPDPDFMVRPLPLSRAEEMAIGITATLIAVAATVVLVRSLAQRPADRRWLAVLVPLLAAGAVVGVGWRIVTAGVIGANIGGGLFMLVGPWIVLALVVGAAAQYYKLWREG